MVHCSWPCPSAEQALLASGAETTCALSNLSYNPRQHGEAQRKKNRSEKAETQLAEGARGGWRKAAEGRRHAKRDSAGARRAGDVAGSGATSAGWSLTQRRGLPNLQSSSVHRYARGAAAA